MRYSLANVTNKVAGIPPEIATNGIDQNSLAVRQHWLQSLSGRIPVFEGQYAKTDDRYHIKEMLLINSGQMAPLRVKPHEKMDFTDELQTDGLPPGRYRLAVELQGTKRHIVRSKQELEFELVPAEPR